MTKQQKCPQCGGTAFKIIKEANNKNKIFVECCRPNKCGFKLEIIAVSNVWK